MQNIYRIDGGMGKYHPFFRASSQVEAAALFSQFRRVMIRQGIKVPWGKVVPAEDWESHLSHSDEALHGREDTQRPGMYRPTTRAIARCVAAKVAHQAKRADSALAFFGRQIAQAQKDAGWKIVRVSV